MERCPKTQQEGIESDRGAGILDRGSFIKVRSGPVVDDECDYRFPVWTGVLPLEIKSRAPIPDDRLVEAVSLPDYVRFYDDRLNGRKDR